MRATDLAPRQHPVGSYLQRWEEVQRAVMFLEEGGADLLEKASWRVERAAGGDILIVLRGIILHGRT